MRVLEKNEQTISNHCCVCGNGLDRNRMDLILDTGYDNELPGNPMDGRRYIGQCCIWDIARAAGLMTASQLDETKTYLRRYRAETELLVEGTISQLEYATNNLKALPAAPNLDHLDTPAHVLVAEQNELKTKAEHKDWVEVNSDEAPF